MIQLHIEGQARLERIGQDDDNAYREDLGDEEAFNIATMMEGWVRTATTTEAYNSIFKPRDEDEEQKPPNCTSTETKTEKTKAAS